MGMGIRLLMGLRGARDGRVRMRFQGATEAGK